MTERALRYLRNDIEDETAEAAISESDTPLSDAELLIETYISSRGRGIRHRESLAIINDLLKQQCPYDSVSEELSPDQYWTELQIATAYVGNLGSGYWREAA